MKKLLSFLLPAVLCAGLTGSYAHAQGGYTAFQIQSQRGIGPQPGRTGPARAFTLEYNLGKHLSKGFELETGLGIRQQGVRFRGSADLSGAESNMLAKQTLAVVPARLRIRLNRQSEGRSQLWFNLGYLYGRQLFANGWLLREQEAVQHESLQTSPNYHFAEFGIELDAPLRGNYRIGFGINYTQTLTPAGRTSYMNSHFNLAGFRIRIARRTWRRE